MFHLDDRVLEKLVTGSASGHEAARYSRHAAGCRQCGRMLEEWRDNFQEIDEIYPWLGESDGSVATVTPAGMMVTPGATGWKLPQIDPASALWLVALVMALLVGFGAHRMRKADAGLDLAGAVRRPPPASAGSGAGAVAKPDTAVRNAPPPEAVKPPVTREKPRTVTPAPAPIRAARSEPATEAPRAQPTQSPSRGESLPASEVQTNRTPSAPPPLPVSSNFRKVSLSEAAEKLGGQLRLLEGLQPDHVEIGPASAVPGAQPGLDVVRVVYRTGISGRILLDQQLIPADQSGFRPLDDPALEKGETAFGTAPNGVSVGTWLDNDGYRMSLVARASVDSLRRLVPLVR